MVSMKDKGYLLYIIKHCKRIEEKVMDLNYESFLNDEDTQDIVCFNIFQIGELVKGISNELLTKYNQAPWKDIKGMRDWVAHGYETISLEKIWKTAFSEIEPLHQYCEQILNSKD